MSLPFVPKTRPRSNILLGRHEAGEGRMILPRKLGQPRVDKRLPGLPSKPDESVLVDRHCLRCRRIFKSVDRARNQICAKCSEGNLKASRRDALRPAALPPGVTLPPETFDT